MGNFFKSLFSSAKTKDPEEEKAKNDLKNFDILKYDGMRTQKMGKLAYAIKCFTEALNIQDDFETKTYLTMAYITVNEPEKAFDLLNQMLEQEPDHIQTLLTRINVLFLLDKEAEVIVDCQHVIALDGENHLPHYLMAKAKRTTGDLFGAIADLTKAIALKEDFAEAYLLRAELLLGMNQGKEAMPDAEKGLELLPDDESPYLLRGRIHESLGNLEAAQTDYLEVMDLNPFNKEACLLTGRLLISEGKYDEAIVFFDEVIEMIPTFAKAYAERGRAKNEKGDKDGAMDDLKKSIELNPEGEEAQKFNGQHSNFNDMYKGGLF